MFLEVHGFAQKVLGNQQNYAIVIIINGKEDKTAIEKHVNDQGGKNSTSPEVKFFDFKA
jgi:hypothetical protein